MQVLFAGKKTYESGISHFASFCHVCLLDVNPFVLALFCLPCAPLLSRTHGPQGPPRPRGPRAPGASGRQLNAAVLQKGASCGPLGSCSMLFRAMALSENGLYPENMLFWENDDEPLTFWGSLFFDSHMFCWPVVWGIVTSNPGFTVINCNTRFSDWELENHL